MEIGVVGLGKMGLNIALNLLDHGHRVVGFDVSGSACESARSCGISVVDALPSLVESLPSPRVVWVMVPCGHPTEDCISQLSERLEKGDVLIDAGNSHYRDSKRHAECARERGILFLDVGTSGGKSGARNGACIMAGGQREAFEFVKPVLSDLVVEGGLLYTGAAGSGHFMKMVHNGIEYGMMQAIGEGLEIMRKSEFDYDLTAVARNWNHGSVIRGWLMELMEQQLVAHPDLMDIKGVVDASGEAKWTVETALELEIPTPVIALSLMVRNATKIDDSFSAKAVSALRNGFGGHDYVGTSDGAGAE